MQSRTAHRSCLGCAEEELYGKVFWKGEFRKIPKNQIEKNEVRNTGFENSKLIGQLTQLGRYKTLLLHTGIGSVR